MVGEEFSMNSKIKAKRFGYGEGALVILALSLGTAAIIYGGGFLAFKPISLVAWVLGPLGTYTIIYALRSLEHSLYYASWGLIMVAIGLTSVLYEMVNPFVIFGLLLIILATMGLTAYGKRI